MPKGPTIRNPVRGQTKNTIMKGSSCYGRTHISGPGFNYYSTTTPQGTRTTVTTNHGMNAHTERTVCNTHGTYHTSSTTRGRSYRL